MASHLPGDLNHAMIALFEPVHSSPDTSQFTYYFVFPALSLMFNALIQPSIPTQQKDSTKHIFKVKRILTCFSEMKRSYICADVLCWTGFSCTREFTCHRHLGEEPSSSSCAFMLKCVTCEGHRVFYKWQSIIFKEKVVAILVWFCCSKCHDTTRYDLLYFPKSVKWFILN